MLHSNTATQRDIVLSHMNILQDLHDGLEDYFENMVLEDYVDILNKTTATKQRVKDNVKEHVEIFGYLFMVGDTLNKSDDEIGEKAAQIKNERLAIINNSLETVDGVIWRGVSTNQYTDNGEEFSDYFSTPEQLDNYVKNNIGKYLNDSHWTSHSMSPGVALSFSYGLKRALDRYNLSKAASMQHFGVYDGFLIARVNATGYVLEYDKFNQTIYDDNDTCEYEVLVPPCVNNVVDIISAADNPLGKTIVIVDND